TLFGGQVNEKTFSFAKEYFFWISIGIPFYVFGQAMNPIIRSDGSPGFAMAATVAGAVTNIILDPIMIYGLLGFSRMGMTGAAVATVIGQAVTAVMSIWYLTRMKTIKLSRESFRLDGKLIGRFLTMGITSLLAQVSLVVSMAAVQNMCTKYGAMDPIFGQAEYSQIPLAVFGIVMKFFQIAISAAVGTAAGCIPVAGYNIGAREYGRAEKLFLRLLLVEAIIGFVGLAIVEIFPGALISIFGASGESPYYREFALKCFRIYLCMLPLATVNKGTFIYLQAMGRAVESAMLSLVREIVLGVALPILLPLAFGLDGVLYSFPAADIITFVISVFVIRRTLKELRTKKNEMKMAEPAGEAV
ncbi:MAG: MATE family efflux transporter, partial [Oscillospiraceae bacterium]